MRVIRKGISKFTSSIDPTALQNRHESSIGGGASMRIWDISIFGVSAQNICDNYVFTSASYFYVVSELFGCRELKRKKQGERKRKRIVINSFPEV